MIKGAHAGSSVDDFLKTEGVFEAFQAKAIKEVIAWQLREAMAVQNISKAQLARLMHTSRPQVDRVLDPENGNVTIDTLQKAATVIGRKLILELS